MARLWGGNQTIQAALTVIKDVGEATEETGQISSSSEITPSGKPLNPWVSPGCHLVNYPDCLGASNGPQVKETLSRDPQQVNLVASESTS